MIEQEILAEIKKQLQRFDLEVSTTNTSEDQLVSTLASALNHLITSDFSRLIAILYRLDISEKKLTTALNNTTSEETAGDIIARMIIERQLQKMEARKNSKSRDDISEDERW